MNFFVTYRDGQHYHASDFAGITLKDFAVRGMTALSYGSCLVRFLPDEQTIAHRVRRRLVVGDTRTVDHYCLLTNLRSVYVFPDGKFVVMFGSGQDDALFRRLALTFDESEYMRAVPTPETEVD
jgi:hypothetical protein